MEFIHFTISDTIKILKIIEYKLKLWKYKWKYAQKLIQHALKKQNIATGDIPYF